HGGRGRGGDGRDVERGQEKVRRAGLTRCTLPSPSSDRGSQRGDVMARITRREFLRASRTAVAVAGFAGCASRGDAPTATSSPNDLAPNRKGRRVVVIGGGWGGATAAKYVRMQDPSIEVIMLEPNKRFVSCPFSNLLLNAVRSIGSLTFNYNALREQHGVRIMHDTAMALEPDARRVRVGSGFLTY